MFRKLFFTDNHPHIVYDRINKSLELPSDTEYLHRYEVKPFFKKYHFISLILQFIADYMVLQCARNSRSSEIFIYEFSNYAWLIFSFFHRDKRINLNTNHNLNLLTSQSYVYRKLSSNYTLAYILAPQSIQKKFPEVRSVRLMGNAPVQHKRDTLVIQHGARSEQISQLTTIDIDQLKHRFSKCSFIELGGDRPKLSNEEYAALMAPNHIFLINYGGQKYTERHSGIALECIQKGIYCLMPNSALSRHYETSFKVIKPYNDIDDLQKVILELTSV